MSPQEILVSKFGVMLQIWFTCGIEMTQAVDMMFLRNFAFSMESEKPCGLEALDNETVGKMARAQVEKNLKANMTTGKRTLMCFHCDGSKASLLFATIASAQCSLMELCQIVKRFFISRPREC